jgi:hypothetical protein
VSANDKEGDPVTTIIDPNSTTVFAMSSIAPSTVGSSAQDSPWENGYCEGFNSKFRDY